MAINSYKFPENENTKIEHFKKKLAVDLKYVNGNGFGFFNGRKPKMPLYQGTQQCLGMFPLQIM